MGVSGRGISLGEVLVVLLVALVVAFFIASAVALPLLLGLFHVSTYDLETDGVRLRHSF